MDAQVGVARRVVEQLAWQQIKPPGGHLERIVWDQQVVTFVFSHPTRSGDQYPYHWLDRAGRISVKWTDDEG